jgi:hypothetical protein
VTRFLILACAATALGSAAVAQTAPKPIARGDFAKTVDGRFNTVDANHDGKITKDELFAQQQRDLDQAKARINQQLQARFNQLDTNHDGKLSLQEFMAISPPVRLGENADQILQRLDTNHDGKISAEEFRAPELAKFNKIDANHDGVVTPAEIKAATGKK